MKRLLLALGLVFCAACAGARAPSEAARAPAAEAPPAPPPPEEAKPEYERILGSFAGRPDLILYLTPEACLRWCKNAGGEEVLAQLAYDFARLGAFRGEAAARINHAAILWHEGEVQRSYVELRDSLALSVRAGDVEGMAHAYEWLGWLFKESGAIDDAGDHLAVAYQLFGRLENRVAQERVLGYAD
jgi:hypothetical protein